jgi:hypothetical protein
MRSVLSFIFVFFISATGQTTPNAISEDILYDDISSLYVGDNSEHFSNGCRNTPLITLDKHLATENAYLFDDCEISTQPEPALLTYNNGGVIQLAYFSPTWTKPASSGFYSMYTGADISNLDGGGDDESAIIPKPGNKIYGKVVFWIKDAYHAWTAKDHYGSTRLLLLSFGLVGIVGIRRKFKKN